METTVQGALPGCFAPETAQTPYAHNEEHLDDLMKLLSVYLSLGQMGFESEEGAEYAAMPGAAIDCAAARDYVDTYPPLSPAFADVIQKMLLASNRHVEQRADRSGISLRFVQLCRRFALNEFQCFCVLCALGCERDRGFEQLFVALHQEPEIRFPTLGTAWFLFGLAAPGTGIFSQWDCAAAQLLFEEGKKNTPFLLTPLVLRREVFAFLCGGRAISRQLQPYASFLEAMPQEEEPLLQEDVFREARSAVFQMEEGGGKLLILCGKRGCGKKRTLRLLAGHSETAFLHLRLDLLWQSGADEEIVTPLAVAAMLGDTQLCLALGSGAPDERLTRLLELLVPYSINVVLLAESLETSPDSPGWTMRRIDYPMPNYDQSLALWQSFSRDCDIAPGIRWETLAAKHLLTPGQIKRALREAALAGWVEEERLEQAIRNGSTCNLGKIADFIPARYTWSDLVLDDDALELMRDICNRIKYRHLVEDVWGFGAKRPYGNGISVLLYGAPGTGKTMSAQVISNELKMPLYRINLAQIISKYIGETAKNMDAIFSEAKDNSVILFFDEADALFSKRTDVNNSNDRHANSESAYLLQKIEEYSGVSILASNLVNNFDDAFRRRIMYFINLHLPGPQHRLALWSAAFPRHDLLEDPTLLEHLAKELEISGSVIKAAALQAAYLAADEGGKIMNRHIAKAARRELQKLGKVAPPLLAAIDAAPR